MKKTLVLLFLFVPLSVMILASDQPQEELLPIGFTAEELTRLDEIGINHKVTRAPSGEIRNPAEWEPSQGVIIRWPLGIPVSLVAEMSQGLMVTTICANSSEESSARSSYSSGGVNMDSIQFIHEPTNTIWTRDYGPWFIFEDDQLAIVDHIYNRPRPDDDVIPAAIGAAWGLDVYGMDLITTGGNHMSNGLGTSMSTVLVYNENPGKTEAEVDSIMLEYLGNDYTVMGYIESGGIHHIDCWAKFLNPTTILVKDVPTSSSSHALLDARADFLSQQISPWGQPYTIVRVYCPYGTAYTNSLILNNKVFVPLFSDSYDAVALQTYEEAMPGYEVYGYTGSFLDDDAIHCRTMGVPDAGMLNMHHVPLAGETGDPLNDYYISVKIEACSDSALIDDSLKVIYSVDGGAWASAMLSPAAGTDMYEGYIPAQATGSAVRYYIQAADKSGRVTTHPYIGAPWAHSFEVGGPHAPSAPAVLAPVDSAGWPQYDMLPMFEWTESTDPDANDTLRYTLEISTDVGFTSPMVIDSISETSYQMTDSLAFSAHYWWRVTAFDRTELTSLSDVGDFVTWTIGDLDQSGDVTMGDLTLMIDHLFISLDPLNPDFAGDLDGSCDCTMGDLTILIDHLFISLSPLSTPGCSK